MMRMITCVGYVRILYEQIAFAFTRHSRMFLERYQCRMTAKLLRLLNSGILGLILFICSGVLATSRADSAETYSGTSHSESECPTDNNTVCINSYLQLVDCFKNISGNHENFSFAFFPNNKASSLYVTVIYTIYYEQNYSKNATSRVPVNSSVQIEEWVWSNTIVYIMYHPTIFKYLSIGYGMIDGRSSRVELTIPRLCHDNSDNYKFIERLTQKVCFVLH